jgi:CDP-glucose 4,6-dehydratase
MNPQFWAGRSVLVTGHTGFKGAWLCFWLHRAGAHVHGLALDPPSQPNLYDVAGLASRLTTDVRCDINDYAAVQSAVRQSRPEVVLHLAAQSLVRESYRQPLSTFSTNTMGTAHVLEAVAEAPSVRAVVVITTDKVYENREWVYPYREVDPLGGHDPYSASKAAAEIVAASYRASFLQNRPERPVMLATARAGNVIGGGDWASERLVPDCLQAFAQGEPVQLRYPHAVRPWQHVLEPLSGYMLLAEKLLSEDATRFATAWNFGPGVTGDATAGEVARQVATLWGPDAQLELDPGQQPHEAGLLRLDVTRARSELHWRPRWNLAQALARTVQWYKGWRQGEDPAELCASQIDEFQATPAT